MVKQQKLPEELMAEIKKEVWSSFEKSLARLSKKYSTKEYDMIIGFDKNGITAEKAWL